jgi:uncharacterized membrane protein
MAFMSDISALYASLKLAHLLGAGLVGGGLIGVLLSDLRSRQIPDLRQISFAIHDIPTLYNWFVIPGSVLLLVSGVWLIVLLYSGWEFLRVPWLTGMAFLFAFEFLEANTITRTYLMKLRWITRRALKAGHITAELEAARHAHVPTFMHFLHLPLFLVIVSLGVVRPVTWTLFTSGTVLSVLIATVLSIAVLHTPPE